MHSPQYPPPSPVPPYAPAPSPAPSAPSSPVAVVAAASWRVLIVICAFVGFNAALDGAGFGMRTVLPLSQFASLAAGACYAVIAIADLAALAMKRPEPPTAWLRGQLAVTLLLVMVVWFTVMEGDVDETWSLFEHLLTPLAVLVDWFFLGRRQTSAPWWYPVSWIGPLLVYLVVLVTNEQYNPYDFMDPDDPDFYPYVGGFLVLVLVAGFLFVAVARARRGGGAPHGGQGGYGGGYPGQPGQVGYAGYGQQYGAGAAPAAPGPAVPPPPGPYSPQQWTPQPPGYGYGPPPQAG